MPTVVTTTPTVTGYNYSVYLRCDTNSDGDPMTDTAERTVEGWGTTREEAAQMGSEKAKEILGE